MKSKIVLFLFLLIQVLDYAQNTSSFGRFNGQYFSVSDLNSSSQIWTGTQDKNFNVFFGNNDGILSFNGKVWKMVECDPLHSGKKAADAVHKSKVTKIYETKSGKIYVGRNDNFGEIQYSKTGKTVYHPLYIAKIKNSLGQVWNIIEHGNLVYFIGEKKILVYNGKKFEELKVNALSDYYVETSSKLKEGLLLTFNSDVNNSSDKKYVYYHFASRSETELTVPENFGRLTISGLFEQHNYWYLFNVRGDVYRFKELDKKLIWDKDPVTKYAFLKDYQKINSVKYHNKFLYIATENYGLLVCDLQGKIVRVFDLDDKMENINVFDFFHDSENNLWLCLDNGVQFFETTSPLTYYDKTDGILDVINCFDVVDGKEYVASAGGISTTYLVNNHKKFKHLEGFDQEVFDLKSYETSYGKKTIAIAGIGIYEVNLQNNTNKLIVEEYAWLTVQNPLNKNEIFVGSETSLGKLTLSNKGWSYEILVPDLEGDIRDLVVHNGKLIYGSENKGVFVYDLRTKNIIKVKNYQNKIVNTSYVIEKYKGRVFVGFETGLYYLSDDFKQLIPFNEIDNHFLGDNSLQIHRLINQDDEKLWIVINHENAKKFENGWLEFSNHRWTWVSWPFEQIALNKDPVVFDILKLNNKEIWFGAGSTISSFNPESLGAISKKFTLAFDEVSANDKLLVFNPFKAEALGEIPYEHNSLNFVFHANSFIGMKEMKYRFKLDNYTEQWSKWSELNFADFKKIGEGTYTLKVQAKNIYGFESEILSYTFTILPPWYRTWWAYTIYVISFFFLIYATIRLSIQRVKNQNIRLEEIVEERTSEIADQNKQLEHQKEEIQQKTKDIVDSIVYAKRIQDTILPNERLERMFRDYFVFYRPKDIVSGDFYWARQKGNLAMFSAIDCTGHGVPGALVSIVGNSSLLRCVNEHRLTEPAEILNKHREIVVKSFVTKTNTDVKDGMDMSLCVLDMDTLKMKYAGANNECVIIRNKEIIELKADKQPIGQFSHAFPFTQQEIQLEVGDCVFQFTDGYVDQFGGEKGKKLKSRPFKEMLISINDLSMKEQKEKIEEFFDQWKGALGQIDDVCVFGVKI